MKHLYAEEKNQINFNTKDHESYSLYRHKLDFNENIFSKTLFRMPFPFIITLFEFLSSFPIIQL